MATWIENQPVFLGDRDECTTDELTIHQIVDNTDITQFQLEVEPCDTAIQIVPDTNFTDPDDYVVSDNWTVADNMLCLEGDSALGATVTTGTGGSTILSIFTLGSYYQVTVVVDSISVGGSVDVWIGADSIGTITSTGTFTFYGFAENQFAIYGYPLAFVSTTEGTNICVSSVSAFEILTDFIIPIYNSANQYITQINYEDNPDYFVFSSNTVTVTINWAELELSNGCYYFCVLDPCSNVNGQNYPAEITNCTFDGSATGWTLSGDATYSGGYITSGVGAFGIVEQANVFDNYSVTYYVVLEVTSVTGSMEVYFGTNLVQSIVSAGTYIVSGVPIGNFTLKIQSLIGSSMRLDSACPVSVDTDSYTCDMTSNLFSLSDYSSQCTLLINACNNENGLGFNFENSGFSPRVRIHAKLKQPKYSIERTIFEDSKGAKGVAYFSSRKNKDLSTDLQPEYIHDFLRLLSGFDNFFIDGERYAVEDDEYSVEYSDASDSVGKVKILVGKITQNVKNINCSDVENVCNLGENILLQADDLSQNILLTTGETILING